MPSISTQQDYSSAEQGRFHPRGCQQHGKQFVLDSRILLQMLDYTLSDIPIAIRKANRDGVARSITTRRRVPDCPFCDFASVSNRQARFPIDEFLVASYAAGNLKRQKQHQGFDKPDHAAGKLVV
jgi:hypothetical protein